MIFKFKDAAHLPATLDPQAVGERLSALPSMNRHTIVNDARSDASPLHDAFTWDDAQAAEERRLEQAGYLVRALVIEVQIEGDGKRDVGAFTPILTRESPDREYLPIDVAMGDEDYRKQILERALADFVALRRKYQDLEELAKVFRAIDTANKALRAA